MRTVLARAIPLLVVAFVPTPALSQKPADLRPTCYAVRGARVVVEPGTVLPAATVVIRDGLVTAVGPDVPVPPDAAVIEGKGLTVYPGFIDAGSPRGFDPTLRRSESGPDEFGLKPMIVGGRDAWKVTDRLKKGNVPVILGLNFAESAVREADLPVRVREDRERIRKEEAGCAAALHLAGGGELDRPRSVA